MYVCMYVCMYVFEVLIYRGRPELCWFCAEKLFLHLCINARKFLSMCVYACTYILTYIHSYIRNYLFLVNVLTADMYVWINRIFYCLLYSCKVQGHGPGEVEVAEFETCKSPRLSSNFRILHCGVLRFFFFHACCIERRAALRGGGASCIRALARQPAADEAALQGEIMKNHSNNSSSLLLVVCMYIPTLCQCLLAQDGDLEGVQRMVRRGIVFHMKRVTPEQGTPSPSPS